MNAHVADPAFQGDLAPIAELCDGQVSFKIDGWRRLIFMSGLRFLVGDIERKMDALLCLNHDNPAYPTKLYLLENVGMGLNWNETSYILGRTWYTFSWRGVEANQSPIEILAAHLAALSKGKAA